MPEILPDVFCRVQFGRFRRQGQQCDVGGCNQVVRCVPASLIEQQHGVRTGRDGAADFVEMSLHRVGIGIGHDDGRADVACWAYRTEDVGVFVALIFGLPRTRAFFRPLIDEAVFLADARFILEPDLNRRSGRERFVLQRLIQTCAEVFLKASITPACCSG